MKNIFYKIWNYLNSSQKLKALNKRKLEKKLREQGYSRNEAKRLSSANK